MKTETIQEQAGSSVTLDSYEYRTRLRASATYLELLLKRVEAFTKLDDKECRSKFSDLILLVLGSSNSWARLYKVVDRREWASGMLKRYVLIGTAPVPRLQKLLMHDIAAVIQDELQNILDEVEPLEAAEKAKRDAALKEWDDHADKVRNVLPDTWFNCQVQHQMKVQDIDGDGVYPVTIGISYPCRGVYSFASRHAVACEHEDREHGRVVIGGEGLALLPHIIRTQADVLRVLLDLEEHVFFNMYITDPVEHAEWIEAGRQKFMAHPVIQALPEGVLEESESHDISRTIFVCI